MRNAGVWLDRTARAALHSISDGFKDPQPKPPCPYATKGNMATTTTTTRVTKRVVRTPLSSTRMLLMGNLEPLHPINMDPEHPHTGSGL